MKRKIRNTESTIVSRRRFLLSSASAVVGVATYSRLGSIAHAAQGKFDKDYVYQTSKEINFKPFRWPSMPPADCPFENSAEITGLRFNGRCNEFLTPGKPPADTWYFSWASDDRLYSPFTDGAVTRLGGGVDHSVSWRSPFTTGQAVAEGDDPINLKIYSLGLTPSPPEPYGGRYPCGSLVHEGVWYYGTYCLGPLGETQYGDDKYNWPWLGPFVGFRISTGDLGQVIADNLPGSHYGMVLQEVEFERGNRTT